MKLNIKHHGRGVFRISGMRAIIDRQCQSVNMTVHIKEPSPMPASYCDIALNDVLISQIAVALEKMDYTPGITPCIDCDDCNFICSHNNKNIEGSTNDTKQ